MIYPNPQASGIVRLRGLVRLVQRLERSTIPHRPPGLDPHRARALCEELRRCGPMTHALKETSDEPLLCASGENTRGLLLLAYHPRQLS